MKRILLISLFLVLALGLFAGGQQEGDGITLVVALAADPNGENRLLPIVAFQVENPDVKLEWAPINVADASTIGMDARIAAGLPVDFYNDYMSRSGKYAIPNTGKETIWALDLSKYIDDLDDYYPGVLDSYTHDGQVLAVPGGVLAVGQRINLDLLKKVGYALPPPEEWTLEEFTTMAEKVTAAALPDTYASLMFAENRSGDWMYMGWLATFGARLFEGADYSKTIINSPEGLKVFEFWKEMQEKGFIPAEAALMNDDHAIEYRDAGRLGAMGDRASNKNADDYYAQLKQRGIEPFKSAIYPYPKAPGVAKVPLVTTFELSVAFESDDERVNEMAARMAWFWSNTEFQQSKCNLAEYPTRKSVQGIDEGWWLATQALMVEHGTLDAGNNLGCYDEIRGAMFPQLQKLFLGSATPAETLALYEEALNGILGE